MIFINFTVLFQKTSLLCGNNTFLWKKILTEKTISVWNSVVLTFPVKKKMTLTISLLLWSKIYISRMAAFYCLNCSCQFIIINAVNWLYMWTLIPLISYGLVQLYLTAKMIPKSPNIICRRLLNRLLCSINFTNAFGFLIRPISMFVSSIVIESDVWKKTILYDLN